MLLVVAALLLPVLIFGATLGVPVVDCAAHHSCTLAHCCPYAEGEVHLHGKCTGHEHSHHCHERILMLHEQIRRSEECASVAVNGSAPFSRCYTVSLIRLAYLPEPVYLPPIYGGFFMPRRC